MSFLKAHIVQLRTIVVACVSNFFFFLSCFQYTRTSQKEMVYGVLTLWQMVGPQ